MTLSSRANHSCALARAPLTKTLQRHESRTRNNAEVRIARVRFSLIFPRMGSGNVKNFTYENIMIETKFFSTAWWGSAEPIYITALPFNTTLHYTGSIRDIYYINITAIAENGIMIASDNPQRTDVGISTEQISQVNVTRLHLVLAEYSNITRACHDFRPGPGTTIVTSLIDGVWASSAQAVFNDCSIHFSKKQTFWGECVNSSLADIDVANLKCHLQ